MSKLNTIIMGAGGRDFHNFLVYFRDNPSYKVVAFTAAQIPGIEKRMFPKELAGKFYKKDIPIYPEADLPGLVKKYHVNAINLAYSDLSHQEVMKKASHANSLGCDFLMLGPNSTMLESKKPVIAVTAVRTGCGKSQTTRKIVDILLKQGKKTLVVRHPMPYGILKNQICERFETEQDLKKYKCTIEESEEYEPLIEMGVVVYAGVDYKLILKNAEKEADVIIWDGGNNDLPFFRPDIHICLTDPHRPGHEISYYPGETNLRMADVVIITKEKTAKAKNIEMVRKNIKQYNPKSLIIDAASEITAINPEAVKGKKVIVIEDGPTLTHGGVSTGAGTIAALKLNAKIVDPRPYLAGSLKKIFKQYPHLQNAIPAMGYSREQIRELESLINAIPCDAVISGTPIRLQRIIKSNKPIVRIRYELQEISRIHLENVISKFLKKN